jgi:zinc protease
MAHLLEHLMFKGSPKHKDVNGESDKHGARNNASTWDDRTNYFETLPATDVNLDWALAFEADRMTNSYIAEKDRASEMTVVRNEFESGENDPFGILLERTLSTAYLWHNYGHSTIGARSDIENAPIERLQAFYHRYYQPDNAVLLVAGKFDPASTLKLVEKYFGAIPKPVRTLAHGNLLYPTYTVEPTQDGERTVTLRRVGDVQAAVVVYHIPALSHPDYAAIAVLSSVLGNEPSGRLYQALNVPKLAAASGAFSFGRKEPGSLITYAQVRADGSLDSARMALLRTADSASLRAPTPEEVERAKTSILKGIDLLLNNSAQVGLQISEWQAAGDWRLLFVHRDRIKKVTPADVQRVAAAYLKPSNATVGLFYPTAKPDRAEIPGPVDIVALVRDYHGDSAFVAGEAFDATPANIDARTEFAALANGMRVSLLPKKTRGGQVLGRLVLRMGTEESLTGKTAAADMAAEMLSRGTATLTRQQLQDSLDRLKARVGVGGSAGRVTLTIQTVAASVPAVLSLVAQMATRPAFDAKEFDQLKQEQLADLESNKSDPDALAGIAFGRRLNPKPAGNPLYTPTIDEQIAMVKGVTLDQVKQFHAQFYGAASADLVLIGDLDTAQVRASVAKELGAWKAQSPWVRLPDPYQKIDSSSLSIETPDKANAVFLAGLNFKMNDGASDYAALVLGNFILGGSESSRLWTRIREHDGLSYGVYSSLAVPSTGDGARWQVYAIYAPQNAARLVADFREEIARALKDGVTAEELATAKAGYLQRRAQSRANDNELVSILVARRDVDRTMKFDAQLDAALRAATVQQVNDAIRKYITPADFTSVKAGDFAKAAPAP